VTRQQIDKIIKENGIMRNHLAKVAGVTKGAITTWLNGEFDLSLEKQQKIDDFLKKFI
jgi:transcriptional regulator with XRE-family HTH domain